MRRTAPATGAPVIGGTAQVGETLRADTSGIVDEDGLENAVFGYQWVADGSEISGATAATYTLVDADEGKTIRVRVSFTDDVGHGESLTSAATAAVVARSNTQESTAPSLTRAVVDGVNMILIYGEDLDEDSAPPSRAFVVTVGGGERTVVGVWVTGNAVWLTLDAAVTAADTVLVSYTAPSDAATRIQDTEGNAAASFSSEGVDNLTQSP